MTISQHKERRHFFLLAGALLLLLILFFPQTGIGEDIAEIRDMRYWKNQDFVRFIFDLSKPVEFTSGKLSNPERLFFDLKNTKLSKSLLKKFEINYGFVKSVRLGQYSADTTRIVFDLSAQAYNLKVMNLEDPARLVIDIYIGGGKSRGKEDLRSDSNTDELRPDEKALPDTRRPDFKKPDPVRDDKFIKRTVVLDAGHGGHDPGAVGPSGLYEKDVVLDIALRVRDIMRKDYPFYDVVLTRDKDVFIPLPERAEIANRHNANLFVSVHANASTNRKARGIETYLLNWTDDVGAMKVAARENAISLKKMKQMKGELGVILASLERENKRDESVKIAGNIQKSLVSSIVMKYPEVGNLGVKQALFYVLVGARMPSSLVEVSFISNPKEEKLLATDSYRQSLARSIAEGIHKYFSSQSPQRVAFEHQDDDALKAQATPVKYSRAKNAR